jgi:hypothetical protein
MDSRAGSPGSPTKPRTLSPPTLAGACVARHAPRSEPPAAPSAARQTELETQLRLVTERAAARESNLAQLSTAITLAAAEMDDARAAARRADTAARVSATARAAAEADAAAARADATALRATRERERAAAAAARADAAHAAHAIQSERARCAALETKLAEAQRALAAERVVSARASRLPGAAPQHAPPANHSLQVLVGARADAQAEGRRRATEARRHDRAPNPPRAAPPPPAERARGIARAAAADALDFENDDDDDDDDELEPRAAGSATAPLEVAARAAAVFAALASGGGATAGADGERPRRAKSPLASSSLALRGGLDSDEALAEAKAFSERRLRALMARVDALGAERQSLAQQLERARAAATAAEAARDDALARAAEWEARARKSEVRARHGGLADEPASSHTTTDRAAELQRARLESVEVELRARRHADAQPPPPAVAAVAGGDASARAAGWRARAEAADERASTLGAQLRDSHAAAALAAAARAPLAAPAGGPSRSAELARAEAALLHRQKPLDAALQLLGALELGRGAAPAPAAGERRRALGPSAGNDAGARAAAGCSPPQLSKARDTQPAAGEIARVHGLRVSMYEALHGAEQRCADLVGLEVESGKHLAAARDAAGRGVAAASVHGGF